LVLIVKPSYIENSSLGPEVGGLNIGLVFNKWS